MNPLGSDLPDYSYHRRLSVARALTEALTTGLPALKIEWGYTTATATLALPDGRVFLEWHSRGRYVRARVWTYTLELPRECVDLTRKTLAKKKRPLLIAKLVMHLRTMMTNPDPHSRPAWLRRPSMQTSPLPDLRGALSDPQHFATLCADICEDCGVDPVIVDRVRAATAPAEVVYLLLPAATYESEFRPYNATE